MANFFSTAGNDSFPGVIGVVDTLSYASATTGVVVDLTISGPQNTRHGVDTLTSIENLIGGSFDDRLIGNGLNNVLDGGAGLGTDTLDGGFGIDTASYASANSAVNVSLAISGLQNTGGAGFDQLINFENLLGSRFGDRLTGDDAWNTLDGGAGNDTMNGGLGTDTASYASASSAVTVSLSTTAAQNTGGAGTDVLSNFENLLGSDFNDTLSGNNGDNVLDGGNGSDFVSYANAAGGVTVYLFGGTRTSGAAGRDTLLNFEHLIGSDFADQLVGAPTGNAINGRSGNDTLTGGGWTDTLIGGAGVDRFVYGSVQDSTVAAPDQILDFAPSIGEKIDLSLIDANRAVDGNQAFRFIGTIAFNPARLNQGELGVQVSGSNLLLIGNTNSANGVPDFTVQLSGLGASGGLIASDIIL